MTCFFFASDLHQEFTRDPVTSRHPATRFNLGEHVPDDVDFVVIAGDLDVGLSESLRRLRQELPDHRIVYIPGNHDFYSDADRPKTMTEMKSDCRLIADFEGVDLLMDDTVIIDGVRIIGATLWTDFDSVGTGFLRSKTAEAEGREGMSDYRRIKRESTGHPGKRKRLRAQDTIAEHRTSRAYIESELQKPHSGETIVVTHHSPHPQSLDFRHTSLNFAYASNLASIFEEAWAPDLWLHGHIHKAVDYTVGNTAIRSNPRGYLFDGSDLNNGFDAGLVIEIGEPAPKLGW